MEKLKYFVFASLLILSIFTFIVINNHIPDYTPLHKPNYEMQLKLGLAPSIESREVTIKDNAVLYMKDNAGQNYALIKSGEIKDFGNTFIVKIK